MERKSSILIGGVVVLIVLIATVGVVSFVTNSMSAETIYFFEVEEVPEGADVVHLTEEDYEKFPVLREIPNPIHVDAKLRDMLWSQSGRYVEHEGVIYQTALAVA